MGDFVLPVRLMMKSILTAASPCNLPMMLPTTQSLLSSAVLVLA